MKATLAALFAVAALVLSFGSTVRAGENTTGAILIEVPDMVCEGCASSVTKELKKLEGVTDAHVDAVNKVALVSAKSAATISDKAIQEAVKEAGYEAKQIKRLDSTFAKAKADLEKKAG